MNPTEKQSAAIDAFYDRTVVIAGPGSGKTATLVLRIAKDTATGRIDSARTAVITFTNAAANQLRERLEAQAIPLPRYIGTLHGFAMRHLDNEKGLAVLSADGADKILAHLIEKNRLNTTAKKVRAAIAATGTGRPDTQTQLAVKIYRKLLKEENAIDFDLILSEGLTAIETEGTWCQHLYVDEYQDSGTVDAAIYEAIAPRTAFIVGDPDQSIYAFRGGRPANLMEAAAASHTTVVILEDNFRSLPGICLAANAVIERGRDRVKKWTKPIRAGAAAVTINLHSTEENERAALVEAIKAKIESGTKPQQIAVLVRYNNERRAILSELQHQRVAGAEPPERLPFDWKATIAVLRAMQTPDNLMMAADLIATDKHCTWEEAYETAKRMKREGKDPMPSQLRGIKTAAEAKAMLRALRTTRATLLKLSTIAAQTPGELADAMSEEQIPKSTGITVATYHGSKGLEWPVVFLPAAEDNMVGKEEEETRRLFFVAMTRAENELHISAAMHRQPAWGNRAEPTGGLIRFAKDIPAHALSK